MVRAAADKPGVLYAFIVLDNPANSILDMQVRRWASCRWGARQKAGLTPARAVHTSTACCLGAARAAVCE